MHLFQKVELNIKILKEEVHQAKKHPQDKVETKSELQLLILVKIE